MKILFLLGTRPEAIKLVPVILAMKRDPFFIVKVCVTAQHRSMLDQVLSVFDIVPDQDLNLMTENQSLASLTARIIEGVDQVVRDVQPDICIVQGDTSTVLASVLACFYNKVPVAHVEAGLRTFNKYAPFPEEINRIVATHICHFHFAPTEGAKRNLLRENIAEANILVTGNTVIDALHITKKKIENRDLIVPSQAVLRILQRQELYIIVTCHRRENFGDGINSICSALKRFAEAYPSISIVFPVHLNPNIQRPVSEMLSGHSNVCLLEPLDYISFVALMSECYFILTDSGGIQEEAPGFRKPVLVLRDTTERPEAVAAGIARLVGTDEDLIYETLVLLVEDKKLYGEMASKANPYGNGNASERIVSYLKQSF